MLVIADGMGGHAHGEVASAVTIQMLQGLDVETAPDDLIEALQRGINTANEKLSAMVAENPALDGMGTTLTAMLWSGSRVALGHIGDSRAYLLRDGGLYLITEDHSLVNQLVKEGRITAEEAQSHPQRSLLLRALGGQQDIEPDIALREAQLGDRYLLCSDGLSSVVSAETIHDVLSSYADPDQAIRQLIDLANRGGGPDNITCVLGDVIDTDAMAPTNTGPQIVGAAAAPEIPDPPSLDQSTPAGRAAALKTMPQNGVAEDGPPMTGGEYPMDGTESRPGRRRRWPWMVALAGALIALIAGGAYAFYSYTQTQYYIGNDHGTVAIYQGLDTSVLGVNLSKVYSSSNTQVRDLPSSDQTDVNGNISATSLTKAKGIVGQLTYRAQLCNQAAKSQQQQQQQHSSNASPSPTGPTGRSSSPHSSRSGEAGSTGVPQPVQSSPPPVNAPAGCPQVH